MRIGILGSGALGTLFAAILKRHTSHEVWLFARRPDFSAVTVEGKAAVPVRVTASPEGPVDLLLVLVKAYATAEAMEWARPAVGPETIGLTLQNGLGNAEAIARIVPPERLLVGTTAQGATWLAPGHVRHAGAGPTYVAPWSPEATGHATRVAALLEEASIAAEFAADPQALLWAKVAVNCGINALTAILRVPNGELLARPGARRLMEEAAREAGNVAAATGVLLPGDPVARTLAVAQATAANRSSMLQDLERGRRTEIDAINGAVARRGAELGLATPVNQTLTDLVRSFSHS